MAHVASYKTRLSGEKRYRVRWETASGQPRSKSFQLKRDADLYCREMERRADLGDLYEADSETFGVYLDGWLERYRLGVRKSTYDRKKEVVKLLEDFRTTPLEKLTSGDVEDHIMGIAAKAPRQAQMALQTMLKVLRDAQKRGHRIAPALFDLKAPKAESTERRFLSWSEVETLADSAPKPYGNLIRVAALTGLRQGELFALRDSSLDLAAGTLMVEASAYKGDLQAPKTRAGRRKVDLSPGAVHVLKLQLVARTPNPQGLVFPSPDGKVWNDDNFRHRIFKTAVERAGFGKLRFHDLRHTYAALMVMSSANAKYLQAQMGHSSIKVTLDDYGHLFPDENRSVLTALDGVTMAPALKALKGLKRLSDAIRTPSGFRPLTGLQPQMACLEALRGGSDGTRTRDLRRDRPAF